MCKSASENNGVPYRCNKHNAYGKNLRNIQAKKQYSLRELQTLNLDEKRRAKLNKVLVETTKQAEDLKASKKALGKGLSPYTMNLSPACETVLKTLEEAGLRPFIVGGSVRDTLLNADNKDIDIEVYGGNSDLVSKTLKKIGKIDEVGKAFGVLKITIGKEDFDVSLPRKDSKVGDGHKGFEVKVDENLSLEEATARRDFTLNALMYNHSLGFIVDKHGGLEDLENKTLRHTSTAFGEDPLRVLRGTQMAARFGFEFAPETIKISKQLKDGYKELAVERVQIEFQKLYEKGEKPHKGFKLLKQTSWDTNLPGLAKANTKELRQQVKKSTKMMEKYKVSKKDRPLIIGAIVASNIKPEHQRDFLTETMVGDTFKNGAHKLATIEAPKKFSSESIRHFAKDIPRSVTINNWVTVQESLGNKKVAQEVYKKAKKLGVLQNAEPDLLKGNHVADMLPDKKSGQWVGKLLTELREAQYAGKFSTEKEGVKYFKKNLKKFKSLKD